MKNKRERGWVGITKDGHPCWKGGRIIDRDGYIRVYHPEHRWPRAGGYILEHRYLMEIKLDRPLGRSECVHHKDHNRQNNKLSNLEVVDRGKHSGLHRSADIKNRSRKNGRFA